MIFFLISDSIVCRNIVVTGYYVQNPPIPQLPQATLTLCEKSLQCASVYPSSNTCCCSSQWREHSNRQI